MRVTISLRLGVAFALVFAIAGAGSLIGISALTRIRAGFLETERTARIARQSADLDSRTSGSVLAVNEFVRTGDPGSLERALGLIGEVRSTASELARDLSGTPLERTV